MKTEAQRIAIAEACGVKVILHKPRAGAQASNGRHVHQLPDYLDDLNAIHEAEMMCLRSIHRMESYRLVLKEILANNYAVELDFCACAAHRAEALLKTIGKWVEE